MKLEEFQALIRQLTENDQSLPLLEFKADDGQASDLDDMQVQQLADALKKNTSVKSLSIAGVKIGDVGVRHLAGALQENASLLTLQLKAVGMTKNGFDAICRVVAFNQSVTLLDLSGNLLEGNYPPENDGDCSSVAGGALGFLLEHNRTLATLVISNCQLGDIAFLLLSDGLQKNKALSSLWLGGNYMTHIGLSSISAALKSNKTLLEIEGLDQCGGSTTHQRLEAGIIENIKAKLIYNKRMMDAQRLADDAQYYARTGYDYLSQAVTYGYAYVSTLFSSSSHSSHLAVSVKNEEDVTPKPGYQ